MELNSFGKLRCERFCQNHGGGGSSPRAGRRNQRQRVFAAHERIARLDVREYFAPGEENCSIAYDFEMRGEFIGQDVRLTIKDKNNNIVHEHGALGIAGDRRGTIEWDGIESNTHELASPLRSPYTMKLTFGDSVVETTQVKVMVTQLYIWVGVDEKPKLYMNDPNRKVLMVATVMLRKSDGSDVATRVPLEVRWSSTLGGGNIPKASSFEWGAGKFLGKKDDPAAIFWEQHPDSAAHSDDTFKQTCFTRTTTTDVDKGKSKVFFLPSGVGGDTFVVKAQVFESGTTNELKFGVTPELTVWRKLEFQASEMSIVNHVRTNGTTSLIAPTFQPAYVDYELKPVTIKSAPFAVDYFGLWEGATQSQLNWGMWKNKSSTETPAASENTDLTSADAAVRTRATLAIESKLSHWHSRLRDPGYANLNTDASGRPVSGSWAADAGIPVRSLVGVKYFHPKLDSKAPNSDGITTEWGAYAWLAVNYEDPPPSRVHPDQKWGEEESFAETITGIAYILAGLLAARYTTVIAHEAAHASAHQFQRMRFNRGDMSVTEDHSPEPGLMDEVGSRSSFTDKEVKILRGMAVT